MLGFSLLCLASGKCLQGGRGTKQPRYVLGCQGLRQGSGLAAKFHSMLFAMGGEGAALKGASIPAQGFRASIGNWGK